MASLNDSLYYDYDDFAEEHTEVIIVLPIIIVTGLIGNILSLFTIFHSNQRHSSANQYLIVMTSSDILFLVGVGLIALKVDYTSYEACAVVEYFLISASYVSSWTAAALTIERYIALVHPLRHKRLSDARRVRLMLFWVPIPFVLNLFQFVNLVPGGNRMGERGCVLRSHQYMLYTFAADMMLSFCIPCAIVVVLNLIIVCSMKETKKMTSDKLGLRYSTSSARHPAGALAILWVVPMTYFLLNTPFYIIRLLDLIHYMFGSTDAISPFQKMLYNCAHYLYYLNFSCDVLVYSFSSANFRKSAVLALRQLFGRRKRSSSSQKSRSPIIVTAKCEFVTTAAMIRADSATQV